MTWLQPLTLAGREAILEPLSHDHHDGLCQATLDGDLFKLWYTVVPGVEGMRAEIDRRLGLQEKGLMLTFTPRHAPSGRIVGMTTSMNVDSLN